MWMSRDLGPSESRINPFSAVMEGRIVVLRQDTVTQKRRSFTSRHRHVLIK